MPTVTRKSGPHNQDTCPLALSWMFKLVIDCGGHRDFINHGCFSDDDVARELGIYWLVDAAESDEDDSLSQVFCLVELDARTSLENPAFKSDLWLHCVMSASSSTKRFPNQNYQTTFGRIWQT